MSQTPPCEECDSEFTYEIAGLVTCPMCGHEWRIDASADDEPDAAPVVRDSVGNPLADGDDVIIVKDLKVKGSVTSIKVGTKVRGIRLVDGANGHDIDAKVDGFGPMMLKSSVVKKA